MNKSNIEKGLTVAVVIIIITTLTFFASTGAINAVLYFLTVPIVIIVGAVMIRFLNKKRTI